jgi:hypothetical protein
MTRSTRQPGRFLAAVGLALTLAGSAAGQGHRPDETDLALAFLRGSFRSPVLCTFADGPRQGLRRVVIVPGPATSERRVDRVTFLDLEARDAERCVNPLGGEEPNLIGALTVTYTARRRNSDTPQREFQEAQRDGPLVFPVVSGRLRMGRVQDPPESLREVDFTGGRLRVSEIKPGSDAARWLQDFGSRRRLLLELDVPGGSPLRLPLVEFEKR